MFTDKEQELISKMAELDSNFSAHGIYTPALVKAASESIGIPASWTLLKKSAKVSRGNYQVNFNTNMPSLKKQPAKAAPVTAPVTTTETVDIKQQTISRGVTGAVPDLDPCYVPFGEYKDLERIITSKMFYPVLITGESGNGKSSSVVHIHAKNKLPLIRLNMTKRVESDNLIGSKTLINGNVVVVEGPIIVAMRQGCTVLIDEVDAGDPNTLMCLQTIMEGKSFYFSEIGEVVRPAPGFNIIMTANTKGQGSQSGRYIGTQILNEAFLERIAVTIEQEYPSAAIEKKIVMKRMEAYNCVDETFAEELVKWADSIRRSFADGAVDSVIATRRLDHIVRGYSIFRDKRKCVKLAVNRFDTTTKEAFFELFDKICSAPAAPEVAA